jgi:hypothetical protein
MSENLPIVEPGVPLTNNLEEMLLDPNDYFDEVYKRLEVEQPELHKSLDAYIQGCARDDIEAQQMRDSMVITYLHLEAQAKADSLKGSQE